MQISIVNGPNLNLLGVREKSIYGAQSFETYFEELKKAFPSVDLQYFQSNHEGELLDYLHKVGFSYKGIVLNAGAFTHTSVALADAIAAIETPVLEVHISNIYAREAFRHHSYLTKNCVGIISGLGLTGYKLGVQYLLDNK
ncbi:MULTISPECIES: type II 3-dehydroquinate dehydratase [unclassified Imperialibacter]|uniref:type II 3-dehydroquinate dehydratase n=1 Tax=unclassified Imperialibacter TaxID=2629706 RepID=UPI0012561DFA|nr:MULTISPECIES: type II 3-dehydroquinate dehydratase [unclassified Imperialibacter]CAD5266813.1 3-dehydroquinate dehydratase [Imperialibacter sp. 75]CAD5297192.1 3-dehydroquinate dehydratase [Imperialibacter sp. 89]VVT27176.1 3-dehydroquinate dehydratase [Imperialibacter sp. EC-SDR9]